MHRAEPVLEKNNVLKKLANYLIENPKTTTDSLWALVKKDLLEDGIIGEIIERNGNLTTTFNRYISDEDALLINECIYDLLYDRVLTPGVNESNLELPFIHVSDFEKLKKYL